MKVKIWLKDGVRVGELIGKTTRAEILPESCTGRNNNDEFVTVKKANNLIHIPMSIITGIERYNKVEEIEITAEEGGTV